MTKRFLAALLLVWALGFGWFAVTLAQPVDTVRTDAVVVPTGGGGRIQRGLEVLERGEAQRMFVTGVDREVRPEEFAAEFDVTEARMECCVTLGYAAVDTRGNAAEAAKWVESNDVESIRLVTTDWHMRRAHLDLGRELPGGVVVYEDAVASEPSLYILFLEYHKLLADYAGGFILR